ncbi:MAG: TIGR02099 family protein [Betaproteobacteria bacterium]|nr:TIGR02099 family protein [Betaproteobacteria bacterium]
MNSRTIFILLRFLRFLKYVLIAVGVLAAVFIIGLLVLRFVLLPQWEAQPSKVANFIGDRIGLPVAIGTLETSWDWWRPQLTARDVKIFPAAKASADSGAEPSDAEAEAQVALPEVGAQIDTWNSLFHLDVRFQRLWIDQPTLIVRRDTAGRFFVGGVLLMASPEEDGDGSGGKFVDWLLRQRAIEINSGTIEWRDEKRSAPPLVVEQMDFRAERSLSHYRFGLRGDLVSETGATFEVRGEAAAGLLQRSFDRDWQGYVRLDRVDLGSLRQWLDLPIAMTHGEGNVQTWVTLSKQRVVSATVDMALQNVKAALAPAAEPAIAPLELQEIRGRFTAREERNRLSFSTEGLTFIEKSGARLEPMNVSLTLEGLSPATPLPLATLLTQAPSGRFEFDRLNVSALSGLLPSLPLPDGWREPLAALDARGTLENGSGSWERVREENKNAENKKAENENVANEKASEPSWRLIHYSARATVRGAGVQAYGAYPGLRGISGAVSLDEQQGSLTLAGREVVLDLPRVFPEALSLDTVGGNVHWMHKPEGLVVQIDALHFSNPDVEGTIKGTWQANGSDGIADLSAQVQRATASGAYRYIPIVAGEHVRHWLQESLKGGTADRGTVTLKGELEHFPFADGKQGSFVAEAHVAGARLAYDPAWPAIDGVEADLRFENNTMAVTAKRGSIFETTLGQTRATIPDLGSHQPHLHIDGSASGPLMSYLNFLEQSPVGGWLDHMFKGAQASGNGALALKLDISLSGDEANAVKGSFKLADDTLDIPGVPLLSHTRGTVFFTGHEVKADALSFEALGGTGTLALTSRDGGITLTGSGTANLAKLHLNDLQSDAQPLLERLSGTTPWQLTFNAGGNKGTHWVLTSSLVGASIDLPEPLGKSANATAPLRIAHDAVTVSGKETANKEEHWRVDYRSPSAPLAVVAKSVPVGEKWKLERARLHLGEARGAAVALPATPGLSVRGTLARFNTEPWYALYQSLPKHEEGNVLPLDEVEVSVGTLNTLMGRQLHEVKLSAHKTTNLWNINFACREAEGNMTWEQADANGAVNGRLKGYFTRLALAEVKDEKNAAKRSTVLIPGSANPWPVIDFKIDNFSYKEKNLGQLSIQAEPRGTDWRMENVALANADGVVTANGWWHTARQAQRTELNIETKINDAEKFLDHFGVPRSVVAADVQLDGALSWEGAPSDFDINSLDGHLTLNVGRGHFTRIEPGIGRLLGVFSLQALPRRITLDFRDIFSEGFAFDAITGTIDIKEGILRTADLQMNGASAKVKLNGTVDLSKEAQNLNVYVQPSLTDSVSVGAAGASVLLMANPVGAAAVGIGALVGQLILGNPIEKIFSYEYTVKGSWDDPVVEKKTREGLQGSSPDETSAATESKPENQTQTP